jgi:LmbE family N-acetylglucosaminyl deacetylase
MHNRYHAIYLSPHLDDAALSCGGQIFQRTRAGEQVLIVTITAGDPPPTGVSAYAQSLHDRWQLVSDATAARRAEDLAAARLLGADALHGALPDCIYRFHPETQQPLYRSDDDIFGEVHGAEAPVVDQLATWLATLPPHGELFAPLAAGHHVDHQLTRRAAERAFGEGLRYYEDYPYAQQPGAVARMLPPGAEGWQAETIPLTGEALAAKFQAILAFASQFSTFWRDVAEMEQQVGGYAASVGGERVWRRLQRTI